MAYPLNVALPILATPQLLLPFLRCGGNLMVLSGLHRMDETNYWINSLNCYWFDRFHIYQTDWYYKDSSEG